MTFKETLMEQFAQDLISILSERQIKKLFDRLERISCKISPLKQETGNTQTINRWELGLDSPHYATEAECKEIYTILAKDLVAFLNLRNDKPRELLSFFPGSDINANNLVRILQTTSRIGSLELPIWYKIPLENGGKHNQNNIFWMTPFIELDRIRQLVGDSMIITKIQVKAYLTDRRQTGDYQTNREIRWETHPNSPQFASRIDCMFIEAKLLAQIFLFTAAPNVESNDIKVLEKVLGSTFMKDGFKCPISGKPIFYNEFREKISSPTHGRSGFQVGHLNPLASTGKHIASNTSWITDLGNRVQGESSLEQITNDIFFMADFHKQRLDLSWDQVESIAKKKDG